MKKNVKEILFDYGKRRFKTLLIMKLMLLLSFTFLIVVQAEVLPQGKKISIDATNSTVREVLNKVEENSDYRFFYNDKLTDLNKQVDFKVKNMSEFDALNSLFEELSLTFQVLDNKLVLIIPKENFQQTTIKGKVTDIEGNPLPGVNVVEKGTTNGAVTNLDGEYTISVGSQDAILSFSYVGFLTEEIDVAGKTNVNLTMIEDIQSLEEVVVVGYGTMKRSDITGSVASVRAEKLEELSVSRIDQALQGQISGISVQNTSAEPNAKVTIRIRGANSINGGNTPLVVIDGFQGGDLNTLAPNDIESIEVLKDASATAIYGSRGANGVILVTTKSGKKGKAIISYDSYYSLHQARKTLDVLNAAQYAQVVNENRIELGQDAVFSDSEIAEFARTGGTDWQDEILRNAFAHNHLVSIRGGDENLSYYVSGGLVNMEGIVLNTSYNRYNLRSNVSSQLTDKIKVNLNIYISKEEDHPTAQHTYEGTNSGSPIYSSLVFAPTKSVYEENGDYVKAGGGYGPPTNANPVALALEPIRDNYYNTSNVNAGIDYELAKGLILSINGGYRMRDFEYNSYFNSKPNGNSGSEESSITNGRQITLQNTNMITYNTVIDDEHMFTLTGVYEQQAERYNSNWAGSKGFFTDVVSYNNLGLGDSPQIPTSSEWKRALESYMVRANYTYKSKYLLTLTGRADASSVFGKNHKWGYFPSAAIGWNISSEEFMKQIENIVSQLKVRASYGITGNQAISPYKTLGLLNTGAYYPLDGATLSVGASLGDLANPDLEWEKTEQLDIGTDFKFFEGRIELVADYYIKNTKDLLLTVPLPLASGGNAKVLRNIGEVKNEGIEFYIGGKPLVGKLKWETGFTFGKNKNEVVALRGDETSYALGDAGLPGFTNAKWLEVGQPLGLYKGYIQKGVWKSSEATEAAVYGAFPGAPKFVDQNDDGEINSDDIVPIANAQPDFTFGWTNSFSYKNFDLNILMQGVYGNDILNLGRVRMEVSNSDSDATSTRILNRWTPENEDTDVPSFSGQNSFSTQATSRWVEDGSYLRVKDISLGYTFPTFILQKLKINTARVYFSGSNLFTLTNYSGFDPESSSGTDRSGGVDVAAYPSQKIYTVGLNLKF